MTIVPHREQSPGLPGWPVPASAPLPTLSLIHVMTLPHAASTSALVPAVTPALAADFAPSGTLRAAINLGNSVLARLGPSGQAEGISVDIARELATRLGVALETVVVDAASQSVAAVREGRADVGFFAIDPARSEGLSFTAPYVLIEGAYLVAEGSPLRANDEVDRPGTTVLVSGGSAYDLYLTRTLQAATLARDAQAQTVVDVFARGGYDVAAGVRQQLEAGAARHPGHRLLPGRFMVIEQAMGLPATRPAAALAALRAFVEEVKQGGFLAASMARHGITGAGIAPPAGA